MGVIRLVDFVKSGELFDKIEGRFEQVISDFNFEYLDNFLKINNFGDINNIDKTKDTLIILDKLLPENFVDFFDMDNITILDLNFGINSYGNSISLSKLDMGDLIKKQVAVYEPYDLLCLLENIDHSGKKYIRIDNRDLPSNFGNTEVKDVLSLDEHGIVGDTFAIITTGSMLPEIVRTANILNELGLFVEVFVLNKLNLNLDGDLEKKVFRNKNIVFVADLLENTSYKKYLKTKYSDLNIKFILPEYSNITTVMDEYKSEEARFDAVGLVERLQ